MVGVGSGVGRLECRDQSRLYWCVRERRQVVEVEPRDFVVFVRRQVGRSSLPVADQPALMMAGSSVGPALTRAKGDTEARAICTPSSS